MEKISFIILSKMTLIPPKFISEQRYIWLRALAKTCEYCREI